MTCKVEEVARGFVVYAGSVVVGETDSEAHAYAIAAAADAFIADGGRPEDFDPGDVSGLPAP